MSDRVLFEAHDDHVGTITLNRADKLNALDEALFEGLHDAAAQAREAIAAGEIRAVLLRAEGRAFCAGLDVSLFGGQVNAPPSDEWIANLQQAFTGIEDLTVPVVGAIQGAALGGGMQLALAAHVRMVADDVKLGLLEARWGIIPDLGGLTRLPRLIGLSRATDLAMTARTIGAEDAMAWGLADQVVGAADLAATSRAYAAKLASGPTLAMGRIPALLRASFTTPRDEMLAHERAAQMDCLRSADFMEAAVAAAQGRQAEFTGK